MARKQPTLRVEVSPNALRSLDEIWEWNNSTYGRKRADSYLAFLFHGLELLSNSYLSGSLVPTRPNLRFVVLKKSNKRSSHGHLAVYEVIGEKVLVLNIYHTAQDWQNDLAKNHE